MENYLRNLQVDIDKRLGVWVDPRINEPEQIEKVWNNIHKAGVK